MLLLYMCIFKGLRGLLAVLLSSGNVDGKGGAETCEKTGETTPLWRKFTKN